jgi:hypothetical protein
VLGEPPLTDPPELRVVDAAGYPRSIDERCSNESEEQADDEQHMFTTGGVIPLSFDQSPSFRRARLCRCAQPEAFRRWGAAHEGVAEAVGALCT